MAVAGVAVVEADLEARAAIGRSPRRRTFWISTSIWTSRSRSSSTVDGKVRKFSCILRYLAGDELGS